MQQLTANDLRKMIRKHLKSYHLEVAVRNDADVIQDVERETPFGERCADSDDDA